MKPLVTILLATFNRSNLIAETLNSIVSQTYSNWECIVIDDNSTDSTEEIVCEYIKNDNRFSYYKKTEKYKKGLSGTRNHGLDIAISRNAEFIQFFDDDDLMCPNNIEAKILSLAPKSDLNFTISKFEKFDHDDRSNVSRPIFKLSHSHMGDAILVGDLKVNIQCILWRAIYIKKFRFDEHLLYAEEWELLTRIGYLNPTYDIVDEYLFKYRKHKKSLTMGDDLDFSRRKTSAIIRIKIYEYLTINRLHTKKSILFLAKTFLIDSYQPYYVKALLEYVSQNKEFSLKLRLYLKSVLYISKVSNKIIGKLATWV
ncbi:glycosyltransferase family 2 protein [Flavobacterium denitrificans]|uniref:glycosyltransferase family 2 protein n=1 Tax=Flavobacterium denitrificans TaxID=281361 RepID=UPI0003FA2CDF|nr:glycosyltransferase family 2 protein [Flavobacterium denitrificans]